MARRGFNKNQKRDSHGRWTSGGGSAGKKVKGSKKGKGSKSGKGKLSNGAVLLTTKDPNRFSKRGSKIGGIVGLGLGAAVGQPLGGAGVGILAGSVVGHGIDRAVSRRRITLAERALRGR